MSQAQAKAYLSVCQLGSGSIEKGGCNCRLWVKLWTSCRMLPLGGSRRAFSLRRGGNKARRNPNIAKVMNERNIWKRVLGGYGKISKQGSSCRENGVCHARRGGERQIGAIEPVGSSAWLSRAIWGCRPDWVWNGGYWAFR